MADTQLAKSAKDRVIGKFHQPSLETFRGGLACPFCGRRWFVKGKATGFVQSGAYRHAHTCEMATPEERRAIARLDERRWNRNPPTHDILLNWSHSGMR